MPRRWLTAWRAATASSSFFTRRFSSPTSSLFAEGDIRVGFAALPEVARAPTEDGWSGGQGKIIFDFVQRVIMGSRQKCDGEGLVKAMMMVASLSSKRDDVIWSHFSAKMGESLHLKLFNAGKYRQS